jgi:hypothetical protein
MEQQQVDVLVVGGGTGGTAAALQAARRGAKTLLVSEFPWLGGMLTSAGVSCPDGNELLAFQTGIWGAYLRELQNRHSTGLDHGWVSFFNYDPAIGAQIFADWVAALSNLVWFQGITPQAVMRRGDRILGVQFDNLMVTAHITIDGTELGDLLPLGEIPYRWGWELQSQWEEPSAPPAPNELTQRYPVQAPTWVVIMQDFGKDAVAPEIPAPPNYNPALFEGAWENYGGEQFLNYGRLPGDRFMINWPIYGNDYGEGVQRVVESKIARQQFEQEAQWHSQSFARFIQQNLGRRYGLATETFPKAIVGGGAFALHPYYRESRRLQGLRTVREQDILPIPKGQVAALPIHTSGSGCLEVESWCEAIAIGNYPNDHHYPSGNIPLRPKSIRWGGRWTGTPFAIPYGVLIPEAVDGFLCCDKNISVSHIVNGATRLQPIVLGIGQAAGMAAALCVEQGCQPRELTVRSLQTALLHDPVAPAAVIPLFNLLPVQPDWLYWQQHYLNQPETYPSNGEAPSNQSPQHMPTNTLVQQISGTFHLNKEQDYTLQIDASPAFQGQALQLVTLCPIVNQQLAALRQQQLITVIGSVNLAGRWVLVNALLS